MQDEPVSDIDGVLNRLCASMQERGPRSFLGFKEYLALAADSPERILRNIFQRIHDFVLSAVGDGENEYPDDPESIHYVQYDCGPLFVEGADNPFFADRLFANRLINHIASFRQGLPQNRIYIFEGPHGSGKSTFLNNFLMKLEAYSQSAEGICFETIWRLDRKEFGEAGDQDIHALLSQLRGLAEGSSMLPRRMQKRPLLAASIKERLDVPCPSHDNPLLLVPRANRRELLNQLLPEGEFKRRLFVEKQFEWVFRDNPCTICQSLFQALLEKFGSPAKVYDMIFARRYVFNRRTGEGISVFNPGDKVARQTILTNTVLRDQLNSLLRNSNLVKYVYSHYAGTNNGVYALMDVKANNKKRFAQLHGIISEGLHKLDDIEENVNSLFLALMNPEDKSNIETMHSFADRVTVIKIPYVLDYNTEVKIYRNVFGEAVESCFLPQVLQNFAKVIISSRLRRESKGMQEWIPDPDKYNLYCDKNLHLLKMEVYAGLIPPWLTQDDCKRFTAKRRKAVIGESESEGDKGFSGRDSIKIFGEFLSVFGQNEKLVNMGMLCNFFRELHKDLEHSLPEGFLEALTRSYNYAVLQEVKESLYSYNEDRISRDIQNYIFASNFEPGRTERCVYSGETIAITEDFFENIEQRLLGSQCTRADRLSFRSDVQARYTSRVLTQEMMVEGKTLNETTLYASLYDLYTHKLKEKVLEPFRNNDTFRNAIKEYGTESFSACDRRIQDEVNFLMRNLMQRYGYTSQGAKEICIYVIDQDLSATYAS